MVCWELLVESDEGANEDAQQIETCNGTDIQGLAMLSK